MRRTPWPVWDLRPDQPRNRGEDLRCAGGDIGAVGSVGGTTHDQRRRPNPFQRVSAIRRRIDAAGCGVGAGMAARWETLTGRPTRSAECPTRFNGFRLSDAELMRRAGGDGGAEETLAGRPTNSAEGPTRFNGFRLSDAELMRRAGMAARWEMLAGRQTIPFNQ